MNCFLYKERLYSAPIPLSFTKKSHHFTLTFTLKLWHEKSRITNNRMNRAWKRHALRLEKWPQPRMRYKAGWTLFRPRDQTLPFTGIKWRLFQHGDSWGGGGILQGILDGGMPPGSPNLLISDEKCHFSFPFSDLASKKLCDHYWHPLLLLTNSNTNDFFKSIRISMFLFPWNLSEIETINTFIHSRSSPENQTRFQT